MVEIGRKDDSWQKPAGREPAGLLASGSKFLAISDEQ
jgi:hypothetical protein